MLQDAFHQDLGLNRPPMPNDVFDVEYVEAQNRVLTMTSPGDILGEHRWTGTEQDKLAGAQFTGRRLGTPPDPRRVVLTNGTQSALLMLFSGLVGNGGVLLTEALTYPPVFSFARHLGLRVVGAPLDHHGLRSDALEAIIHAEKPKALYMIPTYQNPTTSIMPLERRLEIVQIMRKHNIAIVEDDIYSLFANAAPPPLSALAPEISWYVLGTAKSIAAGMRVAYVVAPTAEAVPTRFWPGVRGTHWMAAPLNAAVMTRLIETGGSERILSAVSDEVGARQELVKRVLSDIPYIMQPGGLHVWFELAGTMKAADLVSRVREKGVIIGAGQQYQVDNDPALQAVRIGIGNPKTRERLDIALHKFLEAYRETAAK